MQRFKKWLRIIQGKEVYYPIDVKLKKDFYGSDLAYWCVVPHLLNAKSIVYSFGVGTDLSFDLGIIERFGLKVFAFDPTPRSIAWVKRQKLPRELKFFEYGIAKQDTIRTFYPPSNPNHVSFSINPLTAGKREGVKLVVYRLETIMKKLGHKKIDLLKMDIEGSEYEVIQDLIKSDIPVKQLLVEFHHRFNNFSIEHTRNAIDVLRSSSFKIFEISSTGKEYSFIKE